LCGLDPNQTPHGSDGALCIAHVAAIKLWQLLLTIGCY
jgi:hypothetical protein